MRLLLARNRSRGRCTDQDRRFIDLIGWLRWPVLVSPLVLLVTVATAAATVAVTFAGGLAGAVGAVR